MLMNPGKSWTSPRHLLWLTLVGSLGALGFALFTEYVLGWYPCKLCIYQRIPYGVAIAIAAIGLAPFVGEAIRRWLPLGAMLAFMATGGIGVYHSGVEYDWWDGPSGCSMPSNMTLEERRAFIMNADIVQCDQPTWLIEPVLTMAGGNAIYAFTLAAIIAAGLQAGRRKQTPET